MPRKYIVITSINDPTEAVKAFSLLRQYRVLVIGDAKTPKSWNHDGVDFISLRDQGKLPFKLAKTLPENHYCRKMIGYLLSIQRGADFIIDSDDDNIPKPGWGFPGLSGKFDTVTNPGFVNIYQAYSDRKIWPRGFPLKMIGKSFFLKNHLSKHSGEVGVWQGLADEDPDVDAIYRLTDNTPCYFDSRDPIVLKDGVLSPFNSQNTLFRKELFSLLYLPSYVTFRFTDILRGLVAQPIMWLYGYQLGFTNATVLQKRNPHDYMLDFLSEVPMYQYCEIIAPLVFSVIDKSLSIEANMLRAYCELERNNIVAKEEVLTLKYWLDDLNSLW
jgi:hypothetical protein